MRGLLIVLLSTFLVCPAFGQYVYGEAGLTVPTGSFSYAKTGFQAGVTGRLPIQESDVDVSATLRLGYNVSPLPQGEIRRITGILGPEVSYTQGQLFTKAQIGGGRSILVGEEQNQAWIFRSRVAAGVETSSGSQLALGPTYTITTNEESWWGISCSFSF